MKFKENLNAPVLTSKYVVYNNEPIVYVSHHEDGVWEFWSNRTILESEILVLSLEQIIKIDESVCELADMPIEFYAIRKDVDSEWQIKSNN